jgi:type II secretory pathway component PulF
MGFPWQIRSDEQAAVQFDDLASQFDAGLLPVTSGSSPEQGEEFVLAALHRVGVRTEPLEDEILRAAWTAGSAPGALRLRAESRRRRAELARTVRAGLRYPIVLGVLAIVSAWIAASVIRNQWLLVWTVAVVAALALVGWRLGSAIRHGSGPLARLPVIATLSDSFAELPYLEILQGLYAAGVPLLTAHPRAVQAIPQPLLRERARRADQILQQRRPLAEALEAAGALCAETRQILRTGEHTGDLEGALDRAYRRRSDVAGRLASTTARTVGQAAYTAAGLLVVYVVFSFYHGYYGKLLH